MPSLALTKKSFKNIIGQPLYDLSIKRNIRTLYVMAPHVIHASPQPVLLYLGGALAAPKANYLLIKETVKYAKKQEPMQISHRPLLCVNLNLP